MAVITRLKANGGSREEIAAAASEARNKMKLEEQRRSAEDLRLPEVFTPPCPRFHSRSVAIRAAAATCFSFIFSFV